MEDKQLGKTSKFPSARVVIANSDGSNTELLKRALRQLKRAKATGGEIEQFAIEAFAKPYDELIGVLREWMTVVFDRKCT